MAARQQSLLNVQSNLASVTTNVQTNLANVTKNVQNNLLSEIRKIENNLSKQIDNLKPGPEPQLTKKIALAYDLGGRVEGSPSGIAYYGIVEALKEFSIELTEDSPENYDGDRNKMLRTLANNNELVLLIGFGFEEAVKTISGEYPNVNFGIIDSALNLQNVRGTRFREEESSFLSGVIAALKTNKIKVGFLGAVNIPLIQKFEAGFIAGVKTVNPNIDVDVKYIEDPPINFSGFFDAVKAKEISSTMYTEGSDIIYHAAGEAGLGLFQAAKEFTESNASKVWGIGVDSDQYLTVPSELKDYVLSSTIKRFDVAVYNIIKDQFDNKFTGGVSVLGLNSNGVDYSPSGGFIDDIIDKVEEFKAAIINASIIVPTTK